MAVLERSSPNASVSARIEDEDIDVKPYALVEELLNCDRDRCPHASQGQFLSGTIWQ